MYELLTPDTPEQWQHYHGIRRTVLWESRGRFGVYDETHPDEHKPGNFPLLLMLQSEAIGVVRVDVDGKRATLRRVAIREEWQRRGHGTQLMRLVEAFAQDRGCEHLYSFVDSGAVRFYQKCGFGRDPHSSDNPAHVAMEKWL